jgi:hypothetical protein
MEMVATSSIPSDTTTTGAAPLFLPQPLPRQQIDDAILLLPNESKAAGLRRRINHSTYYTHDATLAQYAALNSPPLDYGPFAGAAALFRPHAFSATGGDGRGGRSVSLSDWWAARPASPPPPALRVVDRRTQGEEAVVVPPYHGAAPARCHSCLYLNAAGPVWDVAFAPHCRRPPPEEGEGRARDSSVPPPSPPSPPPLARYLAVATSRAGWLSAEEGEREGVFRHGVGNDALREFEGGREGGADNNLLQIWKVLVAAGESGAEIEEEEEEECGAANSEEGGGEKSDEEEDGGGGLSASLQYMVHVEAAAGARGGGTGAHWQVLNE